jgi:tubulin polyglutamylase TTLL6/13
MEKLDDSERRGLYLNVSSTQYPVVAEVAGLLGWQVSNDPEDLDCDVHWQDSALNSENLARFKSFQRVNHFPGMYAVARKDHLAKNLKAMKNMFPGQFNFFPQTWVLPRDFNDLKNQFTGKRAKTFICKPEASSQGRGIFLTRSLEEIPEKCVVQRYLHKPYLLEGLKFDLRVYVLVAGCDPLRLFIHKEGLVRLATEPYVMPTSGNLGEICMHLTNYAINKNNPKFEFNQNEQDDFTGHKRSLSTFFKHMEATGVDTKALWENMSDIILKTVCIVQPLLAHLYRSSQANDATNSICFQILGFDIFLDHKLRPHLLEVNHTPSFTTDTPLDSSIKKAIIGDALRLLGLRENNRNDYLANHQAHFLNLATKKPKEIRSLRVELKEKCNLHKLEIEGLFKGGYSKLYPKDSPGMYEEFMIAARDIWLNTLGIRPKHKEKPPAPPAPALPLTLKKASKSPISFPRNKKESPVKSRSIKALAEPVIKPRIKLPVLRASNGAFVHVKMFEFSDPKINLSKD